MRDRSTLAQWTVLPAALYRYIFCRIIINEGVALVLNIIIFIIISKFSAVFMNNFKIIMKAVVCIHQQ